MRGMHQLKLNQLIIGKEKGEKIQEKNTGRLEKDADQMSRDQKYPHWCQSGQVGINL